MKRLVKPTWTLVGVLLIWAGAVGVGLRTMYGYDLTPGVAASATAWPAGQSISLDPSKLTLVMTLHPHCPCSRASVYELAQAVERCEGKLAVYVLMVRPAGTPEDWEKTELWDSVATIPGVKIVTDEDGRLSRRFDASTSGQTLVFRPDGSLMFRGGITASRGHIGDNAGQSSILSLVNEGHADVEQTAVFGCSLKP